MSRERDIGRFYNLLGRLEERVGPKRKLANCHWNMGWPDRGVYFFFEEGEFGTESGADLRVVRVGTHAVTAKSKSRLWNRLYEHKQDGGRSVFRDHINNALRKRAKERGHGDDHNHTRCISGYIGQMPFLWVNVDADNGHQLRTRIERNAIALLSNSDKESLDPPSRYWRGHFCNRERVRNSGLWNQNHVDERYDPEFLDTLERLIHEMETET